jgi:RimJ/RimL family protein N-acetyltransferase
MVKDSDSILFLIEDEEQSVIGHIGAINISKTEFELAHLMRGEMTKKTDIVFYAEKALIKWCFSELRVMAAKIEVMTYNFGALSIHERIGFKLARKVPIRKIIDKNGIRHIVCKESEANVKYQIVQYRLDADSFYSL